MNDITNHQPLSGVERPSSKEKELEEVDGSVLEAKKQERRRQRAERRAAQAKARAEKQPKAVGLNLCVCVRS